MISPRRNRLDPATSKEAMLIGDWAKKGMLSEKSFVQATERVQKTKRVQKPESLKDTVVSKRSGPRKLTLTISPRKATSSRAGGRSRSSSLTAVTPEIEDEDEPIEIIDDEDGAGAGSDVSMN